MHSQDLINQFIELRARNVTYAQIAADLNINRNTALRWGQTHDAEIQALAAVQAEALRQKFLGSREQEIEMLAKRLQRLEAEIDERDPGYMENREIMALIRMTRERLDLLCAEPKLPEEPAQNASPVAAASPQN
jgi:hypothetical protein